MAQNRKKRGCLVALLIMLALLLSAGLLVYGAMTLTLNKINRPGDQSYMGEDEWDALIRQEETVDEQDNLEPEDVDFKPGSLIPIGGTDDMVNILLIGQDRRPGETRARSDAMILCSINKVTGQITMVSFLRDLYVQIPDFQGNSYRDNRLNAAYAFGGMELLDAALEQNFGVIVDGNVEVDFDGFKSVIDLLGGVDVELTEEEVKLMNTQKGWYFKTGMNHLDGEMALFYSRIRYIGTDFGRTNRQRTVLTSVFQKVKEMSASDLSELVNEMFPLITTDLSNNEILSYLTELLPLISKAQLDSFSIPYAETYHFATIRGMSVLLPDYAANRELLQERLLNQ